MTLYANIVDGSVFGIFEGPDQLELQSLVLVKVDETVRVGDIYSDNSFHKPPKIEPTEEQVAEKLNQIRKAVETAVQDHLKTESERVGINLLDPDTEESFAFYEKCTTMPKVLDAQQAIDFINSLPKFGT